MTTSARRRVTVGNADSRRRVENARAHRQFPRYRNADYHSTLVVNEAQDRKNEGVSRTLASPNTLITGSIARKHFVTLTSLGDSRTCVHDAHIAQSLSMG